MNHLQVDPNMTSNFNAAVLLAHHDILILWTRSLRIASEKKHRKYGNDDWPWSHSSMIQLTVVTVEAAPRPQQDGLCYDNFVVEQKNFNGAPGLAPDKVHVRSEAHLHTRSCLVVNYCAKTGFYLISRASSTAAAWGKIFEVACLSVCLGTLTTSKNLFKRQSSLIFYNHLRCFFGVKDYAFLAQMEAGSSAEMIFDFLIEARHPCGTTSTTAS